MSGPQERVNVCRDAVAGIGLHNPYTDKIMDVCGRQVDDEHPPVCADAGEGWVNGRCWVMLARWGQRGRAVEE